MITQSREWSTILPVSLRGEDAELADQRLYDAAVGGGVRTGEAGGCGGDDANPIDRHA